MKRMPREERKELQLVLQTADNNAFDQRWAEVKIEGKNIAARSSHASAVWQNTLFVHGGYDVDRGVFADFHSLQLGVDSDYVWTPLPNSCGGHQIRLKNHSAVVCENKLLVFGGEIATGVSSKDLFLFDFETKQWERAPSSEEVPRVDSHCALMVGKQMIVYGGYVSDRASYLKDVIQYDLMSGKWSIVWGKAQRKNTGKEP